MKENKKTRRIALAIFAVLIIAADQITKYLTVKNIPFGAEVPVLNNILHLTYVQNEGAAFSMLSGMRWLFVLLVVIYAVIVFICIKKGVLGKPFELWCIAAISGGAVGNMIDRMITGRVTDMIVLKFLNIPMISFKGGFSVTMTPFAVFNVADIFITCGVIALAVYILFFSKEKKPAKGEEASEDNGEQTDEAAK